jgi:outer membrane protein OmpA-like peptidoglycan-associated protein
MLNTPSTSKRRARCSITILAAALALGACNSMTERQRTTAKGAGIGAGAGAVVGGVTGGGDRAVKGAAIGAAVGAVAGNLWSRRMEEKRAEMQRATQGTGIDVTRTADNRLKVNVPSDFSFDVGRSDIKNNMSPVLDEFARGLDPQMQVRVVGHTDSTGSDRINDPLSVRRAEAVRDYISTKGVAGTRVATEGHGAREPVADNTTVAGRAQNRRVEIFLREPGGGG